MLFFRLVTSQLVGTNLLRASQTTECSGTDLFQGSEVASFSDSNAFFAG